MLARQLVPVHSFSPQDAEPAAAAEEADAFWGEMCLQSWRMELDSGLGAADGAADEQLLVVAPVKAIHVLLAVAGLEGPRVGSAAAGSAASQTAAGQGDAGIITVSFSGWNQGAVREHERLQSWRQLRPQLGPSAAAAGAAAAGGAAAS